MPVKYGVRPQVTTVAVRHLSPRPRSDKGGAADPRAPEVPVIASLWFLAACGGHNSVDVGAFHVAIGDNGAFSVTNAATPVHFDDVRLLSGTASADVTMSFGMFKFDAVDVTSTAGAAFGKAHGRVGPPVYEVTDASGAFLGAVTFSAADDHTLVIDWAPDNATWVGFSTTCDADEHVLGLGGHAFDVDHVGEAFSLWTSEPGIGKADTDEQPPNWFIKGTRHATSFPMPWALRTQQSAGILIDTTDRVDVDLCHTDPSRLQMGAWQHRALRIVLIAGDSSLDAVKRMVIATGLPNLAAPWVFAPWNDAIKSPERVRQVASTLRTAGAPSSVIWTEDWKGGADGPSGYQLTGEWSVDRTRYPDPEGLAAELEHEGFKWFAYFSPFVYSGTDAWDQAIAQDALIKDATGAPYTFTGVTFEDTSLVDLTTDAGRAYVTGYEQAALDVGFDGWMADYAEWLPTDAVLGSGEDAWDAHNQWPLLWQQTNIDAIGSRDASFFVRSGWTGTSGIAPVVWGGDQRTDFEPDDGLPTVIPLGLGLAACGVPVFTHDVAGYQSIGNPPGTKELFLRWAALGAYSPVLRTHHGAFADDNVQFDTDAGTLAQWVWAAREHMRLFPYRYGLAAQAARDGTPMILPIGLEFPDEDVSRTDAWMLGRALLVAPVLEPGATGRDVDLPAATTWYDWHTGQPVTSGHFDADPTQIPVFAAAGTTIPTFTTIPDTLVAGSDPALIDLADADAQRTVYVIGDGGLFTEADGTSYTPSGTATGPGTVTQTLTSGTITVAGVSLAVDGPREREYTVVVVK